MRYGGKKLAPINPARSAAESAAPWAWRGLHSAWLYRSGALNLVQRNIKAAATGIFPPGPAFVPGSYDVFDPIADTRHATIHAVVYLSSAPPGNHGIISNINSNNDGWAFLADNEDFDTGNTDTFACRWRVTDSPNPAIVAPSGTAQSGIHNLVAVYDDGDTWMAIDGQIVAEASFAAATIGREEGTDESAEVGGSTDGFVDANLPGAIALLGLHTRTLSRAESAELSADPWAPYRRRPILVPVSSGGAQTVTVGQATETDTAFAVSATKAQSIGQATETDIAQSVTAVRTHAVGQATETDTAQPVGASKAKAVGQATETDTAFPVTAIRTYSIGQATETDTANSITYSKSVTVGQAQETDEAFPVTATGGATAAGAVLRQRLFLKNVDKLMDY